MSYLYATLLVVVAFLGHVGLTLLFYCAVMALMGARDAGRTPEQPFKAFAYTVLYVGLLLDVTLNVFWGTFVFLDLPLEGPLTLRLIRYKKQGTGWRFRFASWVCEKLLDPVAPDGCHCKT